MRILVTGAGGYIGSVLVPKLISNNHQVLALDRFHFGRDKLPKSNESLEIIKDDIRSIKEDSIRKYGEIDCVIDLAALSNDPVGELDPTITYSINHQGRLRIASIAKKLGIQRYILPSSCSIYGLQSNFVDETSSVNPLTTYSKANYFAERDILALSTSDFCVTALRVATVYGTSKRMRFDLAINAMVKNLLKNGKIPILRDGNQWRPFIHIKDLSEAYLKLISFNKDEINGEIINVGSNNKNYQIFELAKSIANGLGLQFNYNWYGDPDKRSYQVNFDKFMDLAKFKFKFSLTDGIKEIWSAIINKEVNPDDIQTITLQWYQKLISEGIRI